MKKAIAKTAAVATISLAGLGIGTGAAAAAPVEQRLAPVASEQAPRQQPEGQPYPHGFWFFGTWVALPY